MTLRVGIFLVALLLDRVTKIWALSNLTPMSAQGGHVLFSLGLYFNRGITFSLLDEHMALSVAVAVGGLVVLGVICIRSEKFRTMPGVSLLWAGALGNLIDRFMYGFVIDWIYIVKGCVNLADIWLGIGCLQIFAYSLQYFQRDDR
jgi:signal peptidase II